MNRTGSVRAQAAIVALTGVLLAGGASAQAPAPAPAPQRAQPAAAPAPPAPPATPSALADRLGWNSRERTKQGIAALEQGDAAAGKEALDTAHRLRPADPTAIYNAGTGRLAAGDPTAAELLERAAREAPASLQPSAWYNLGEARLAARDLGGAAQAFVETLKRQPQHADAKHNLELALRELQKQQEQQQQQQGGQQQQEQQPNRDPQQDGNQQPDEGDSGQEQEQPNPGEQDPQAQDPKGRPDPKSTGGGQKQQPQFKDLPDMTAEQAAAILRAVDNLERQQRKERAEKAARAATASVAIDW